MPSPAARNSPLPPHSGAGDAGEAIDYGGPDTADQAANFFMEHTAGWRPDEHQMMVNARRAENAFGLESMDAPLGPNDITRDIWAEVFDFEEWGEFQSQVVCDVLSSATSQEDIEHICHRALHRAYSLSLSLSLSLSRSLFLSLSL